METFVKGDIGILPFPFSDLSASKKRPALVLSNLPGDDIILCQISSQSVKDAFSVFLKESELVSGKLIKDSNIRPNRIFTASKSIILYKTAQVSTSKLLEVRNKIVSLLDQ